MILQLALHLVALGFAFQQTVQIDMRRTRPVADAKLYLLDAQLYTAVEQLIKRLAAEAVGYQTDFHRKFLLTLP